MIIDGQDTTYIPNPIALRVTLVNVYVDLLVFTRIAGTS